LRCCSTSNLTSRQSCFIVQRNASSEQSISSATDICRTSFFAHSQRYRSDTIIGLWPIALKE